MRNLLGSMKTRTGVVAIGGVLLLTGAGVATAAVSQSEPAETATTEQAETPAPVESPAVSPAEVPVPTDPAATVEDVTAETSAPAPAPEPSHDGVGTTGPDGNYTPAPPRQGSGEPPVVEPLAPLPPAPPLQGEPNYTG